MDNTRDLPGYKYYVDPETGERPAIYVTYVDLAPDPTSSVKGVAFPVDAATLAALDARERNYARAEVTVEPSPPGRVWAYFGTADARERFDRGAAAGIAVADREYYESVRSVEHPPVPIRALTRIDIPLAKRPLRA